MTAAEHRRLVRVSTEAPRKVKETTYALERMREIRRGIEALQPAPKLPAEISGICGRFKKWKPSDEG